MSDSRTTPTIDPVLRPYLRAPEAESHRLLEDLVTSHAGPIVKGVIRDRLHAAVAPAASPSHGGLDAEDVYGDAVARLVAHLREIRADPDSAAIANFRGYVAVVAYNACHEHFRRRFPLRARLKNRARYLLTHDTRLALWRRGDEWLCGLAPWRDGPRARAAPERLRAPADAPATPGDLVVAIFEVADGPVGLEDLVDLLADLWGVKDRPAPAPRDEDEPHDPYEGVADPRPGADVEVEQRAFLRRLWDEVRELPPRQRAALLLNLRDADGRDAIALFPATGVATIRDLAAALEMPAEELAGLWNDLPLDDATIAARLGLTRQQVINLRKCARERLARRMKGF